MARRARISRCAARAARAARKRAQAAIPLQPVGDLAERLAAELMKALAARIAPLGEGAPPEAAPARLPEGGASRRVSSPEAAPGKDAPGEAASSEAAPEAAPEEAAREAALAEAAREAAALAEEALAEEALAALAEEALAEEARAEEALEGAALAEEALAEEARAEEALEGAALAEEALEEEAPKEEALEEEALEEEAPKEALEEEASREAASREAAPEKAAPEKARAAEAPKEEAAPPWRRGAPWVPGQGAWAMTRAARDEPARPPQGAMNAKHSCGVILCRRGPAGRPEALLVRKRYTYAYAEFVHGRYGAGRGGAAARAVAPLLAQMTEEELFDVWSLNYPQMWYRIWVSFEATEVYLKKAARFRAAFIDADGGAALREAVRRAPGAASLHWEVPKGRHLSAREASLVCAVRELREETGVEPREYALLPGVERRVDYVADGVRYVGHYYGAVAHAHRAAAPPRLPARSEPRARAEVSGARWFDVEKVRTLENARQLEALLRPVFAHVRRYWSGRWGGAASLRA